MFYLRTRVQAVGNKLLEEPTDPALLDDTGYNSLHL